MVENGIKWVLGVFVCSIYRAKWNVGTRARYASASHDTVRGKVARETTGNDVAWWTNHSSGPQSLSGAEGGTIGGTIASRMVSPEPSTNSEKQSWSWTACSR